MSSLLFVHGYGSSGKCTKARNLQEMFPEYTVISPNIDYSATSPEEIQKKLQEIVHDNNVKMIVGSSFGGYHALCAMQWYDGIVWCINPVSRVLMDIKIMQIGIVFSRSKYSKEQRKEILTNAKRLYQLYKIFDKKMFQPLKHNSKIHPNFALSTDDHLLQSRIMIPKMFPYHGAVIWKDHCGHHYKRFMELKTEFEKTLQ